jgi:cellulase/cellobiase CelA1
VTAPPTGSCTVRWDVNQWDTGFTSNVTVTNRGPAAHGWSLAWTFPGSQVVTNAWNVQLTQTSRSVVARNVDWNASLPTGATATFGMQATYTGSNAPPTDFRLNGTPCTTG